MGENYGEDTKQEIQEAKWNAEIHISNQIGQLLAVSSSSYIEQNFNKSFFALKEVKKKISARLTEEEKKGFEKDEDILIQKLSQLSAPEETWEEIEEGNMVLAKIRVSVAKLIDRYSDKVMSKIKTYGFALGTKADTTDMKS